MRQSDDGSDKFTLMKICVFLDDADRRACVSGIKTEKLMGGTSGRASTVFPS